MLQEIQPCSIPKHVENIVRVGRTDFSSVRGHGRLTSLMKEPSACFVYACNAEVWVLWL